mgnify:CR=1 FL=1
MVIRDAIVPMELIGKSLVDARAEVVAAGLLVTGIESVSSDQEAGTVLGVRPEGGSTLPAGSGVVLQIANGTIKVPNLIVQNAIQKFQQSNPTKKFYKHSILLK